MSESTSICKWSTSTVAEWLGQNGYELYISTLCEANEVDGAVLLQLCEKDLGRKPVSIPSISAIKKLSNDINKLKEKHKLCCKEAECLSDSTRSRGKSYVENDWDHAMVRARRVSLLPSSCPSDMSSRRRTTGKSSNEFIRCLISMVYYFAATFLASFAMALIHGRVPNMKDYPPLPDIVLDILPLISWGFVATEYLIISMMLILFIIIIFHKHRLIVLKRMFSLAGTIFLMRCFTMVVTSLSVPGKHLDCQSKGYASWEEVFMRSLEIYFGGGLSINGLRTCGDYMFSGHTSVSTLLALFIDEYGPTRSHFLGNLVSVMWGFSLFFILAAHEHYTIDVLVAAYISTRLFQYYHTLITATNFNKVRARNWYPIFYYLEYPFDRAWVPNEYENPLKSLRIFSVGFCRSEKKS